MNLEHLEALAPEIPLILQPVFSVHSVQFGPQGQMGQSVMSQSRKFVVGQLPTTGLLDRERRNLPVTPSSARNRPRSPPGYHHLRRHIGCWANCGSRSPRRAERFSLPNRRKAGRWRKFDGLEVLRCRVEGETDCRQHKPQEERCFAFHATHLWAETARR